MKKVYVFDLDGTIANIDHRLHFVKTKPKNWPGFFDACKDDSPVDWIIDLLCSVAVGNIILILSGRSSEVKEQTELWLQKHCVPFDKLIMRPAGDYRPDEIVKIEMLNKYMEPYKETAKVEFIVDDRQRVVDMWRKNGYNVLQCQAWAEEV